MKTKPDLNPINQAIQNASLLLVQLKAMKRELRASGVKSDGYKVLKRNAAITSTMLAQAIDNHFSDGCTAI